MYEIVHRTKKGDKHVAFVKAWHDAMFVVSKLDDTYTFHEVKADDKDDVLRSVLGRYTA